MTRVTGRAGQACPQAVPQASMAIPAKFRSPRMNLLPDLSV